MFKRNNLVLLTLLAIMIVVAYNEATYYESDPYKRWLKQLESSSIEVVSLALTTSSDFHDDRVPKMLRALWLGQQGSMHNDVFNNPGIRLELANVLIFQTDGFDGEYFDYIIKQLGNSDDRYKTQAIRLLTLKPDKRTVNLIKGMILREKEITKGEINTLVNIAYTNVYALDVMKQLTHAPWVRATPSEELLQNGIAKVEQLD